MAPRTPVLSEVHVFRPEVGVGRVVQGLALEVLVERAVALDVVLQGDVPVCREGAGKNADVTEHRLCRFVLCAEWDWYST
jgi:hypothetical protein